MQSTAQPQDALSQAKALVHGAGALWQKAQQQGSGPIGIDFGDKSINAVQLFRRGAELRIAAAGSIDYPCERSKVFADGKLLGALVNDLLNSNGFVGKKAVVSAPTGEPKVLSLTFKSGSAQDTARQVMELVKERLGGGDQDWLVDYLPVQLNLKNSQETMVMAAAMPRHESLMLIENLQNSGLYLNSLEIAAQALQRLLKHVDTPQANCVIINFGKKKSHLSHFLQGNLTMDREIAVGYEDFVSPICQSLEIEENVGRNLFFTLGFGENVEVASLAVPAFKRLKNQIDLMNQYVASQLHGDGIDCIYITGEAANWANADKAFTTALGYETKTLNPFEVLPQHGDVFVHQKTQALHSVATGLALWSNA